MKDSTEKPETSVFITLPQQDVEAIVGLIGELIDQALIEGVPPPPNCTCHISPYCPDCFHWSNIRDLTRRAREQTESLRGMIAEGRKAAEDFRRWDSQSGSQIRSKIIESFESLPKQPPPRYRTFGEMAARLRDLVFRRPREVRK